MAEWLKPAAQNEEFFALFLTHSWVPWGMFNVMDFRVVYVRFSDITKRSLESSFS